MTRREVLREEIKYLKGYLNININTGQTVSLLQ